MDVNSDIVISQIFGADNVNRDKFYDTLHVAVVEEAVYFEKDSSKVFSGLYNVRYIDSLGTNNNVPVLVQKMGAKDFVGCFPKVGDIVVVGFLKGGRPVPIILGQVFHSDLFWRLQTEKGTNLDSNGNGRPFQVLNPGELLWCGPYFQSLFHDNSGNIIQQTKYYDFTNDNNANNGVITYKRTVSNVGNITEQNYWSKNLIRYYKNILATGSIETYLNTNDSIKRYRKVYSVGTDVITETIKDDIGVGGITRYNKVIDKNGNVETNCQTLKIIGVGGCYIDIQGVADTIELKTNAGYNIIVGPSNVTIQSPDYVAPTASASPIGVSVAVTDKSIIINTQNNVDITAGGSILLGGKYGVVVAPSLPPGAAITDLSDLSVANKVKGA